ncbi:phage head-binding domain-containing protein [Proteus sp. PR00174]|uniref:phage head-binding domain-containing protein n=1 Tax=Proteus sp. PR00174 TaxID=2794024 RepID=UPI001E3F1950|nr:phage head-binding domain-containing protein [Proteus sp. PR00174]
MSDIIPNVVVSMPSQLFTLARKFQAASNAKIYIGKIDTDPTLPENQIQVYLENEDGSHIPVPQPLIINQAGFPVYSGQIAKFVTVEGHSMAVYDSYGAQQFYYPNVLKYDPDQLRRELLSEHGGDNVFVGNTSVSSIITKTKYTRIGNFIEGCTVNSDLECVRFGDFYYAVRNRDLLPIVVSANSSPDESWICVGDANFSYESHSIFNFGGVDDNGITDNRHNIQLAIEYMEFSGSKLLTNSSNDNTYFGVSSFHPDYQNEFCLLIRKPRAVNISGGRNRNTSIRYTGLSNGKSLFAIKPVESDWGMKIESLGAHAGFKLDHVLFSEDFWLAQNIFSGGCYEGSLLSGIKIPVYMSTFSRVFSTYTGDYGFDFISPLSNPSQPATSINVSNCWARDNKINGFRVSCQLWYSLWSNNGCDGVTNKAEYAYCFAAASDGVTLESNGAENVKRYLYMSQPRSCKVSGIRCATMSPDESSSLITFNTAYNVRLENLGNYNNDRFLNEIEIVAASGNEHISVDITFSKSKLKATKSSGYYLYPNIFYFDNNATSSTRGLTKLNNSIYSGESSITLSGADNEVIVKKFILRKGDSSSKILLMKFSNTNNADVILTSKMSGGANVNYTSSFQISGLSIQNGTYYSHNTNNEIIEITRIGNEIYAEPKKEWSVVVLTIEVIFKYDKSSIVYFNDS